MKGFSDMFVGIIVNDFNKYLNNRTFSESLKLSEFLPVYKRWTRWQNNYGPISILSNLSKVYEIYMHDELNVFFDDVLSTF